MRNLWLTVCLLSLAGAPFASACGGGDSQASVNLPSATTASGSHIAAAPSPTKEVTIGGYLESTNAQVVFLSLTASEALADGQLTSATADPSTDSGVRGSTTSLTAKIVGSTVTIDIGGVQWSGQKTKAGLVLIIPDGSGKLVTHSFTAATSADYNTAVTNLGQGVVRARLTAAANASAERLRQATATARALATLDAAKEKSCLAIGGHIAGTSDSKFYEGNCVSNILGSASGQLGTACELTEITFSHDGVIDKGSYDIARIFYPGCFK